MKTYPEIVKEILIPVYHVYKPYLLPDKERDVKKLKEVSLTVIPFLVLNRDEYLMCSASLSSDVCTIYPFLMNMKSNKRWLESLELFFSHLRSELNEYSRDCVKGEYGEELPIFGDVSLSYYLNSEIKSILEG